MREARNALKPSSANKLTTTNIQEISRSQLLIREKFVVKSLSFVNEKFCLDPNPCTELNCMEENKWDEIWLATGTCLDVIKDPILSRLIQDFPLQVGLLFVPERRRF